VTEVTVAGVTVSHPGKVMFPAPGTSPEVTKAGLAGYYDAVAGRLLPLAAGRPVTMIRYPDGITAHPILQKNAPDYFPDFVTRADVPRQGGGVVHHVVCDSRAALAYLAGQGCVELHVLLSRVGSLDRPDQVIFDLDPPDDRAFGRVRRVALALRALLEDDLGLSAYAKTTGGKGVHVHVPLDAAAGFDDVREFARSAAGVLAGRAPDLVTAEQRRDKRGGRVYADLMRNGYAQTAAAPYTARGRPGAPVATPLHWAELEDEDLTPARHTVATVPGRVAAQDAAGAGPDGDPWAGMARHRPGLRRAAGRLARLTGS
jgi:bifunctional non-homologous end joining protein LigD